jgi:hypothetical protein
MNLNAIVSGAISAVNPMELATIQISTGYTTNPDGTRVPTYQPARQVLCQIQSLAYNDLFQLDGLNIQGVKRKIYINGHWDGVIRADGKGGDVLTMPNGDVYLVVLVLEHWAQWSSLAVTLQDGS